MAPTKQAPDKPTLESLDARIRALETHHGWKPGEVPPPEFITEPPPAATKPADDGDEKKDE